MDSRTRSLNYRSLNFHIVQRTASLAQEVLERAKTRKLNWPLPVSFQRKTLRKRHPEDSCLDAAFATVAEHMGHISEECENYYCCVPPFQFKEYEVAHIFRYHSREASENLLKAFRDEESKAGPSVEQSGTTNTEIFTLLSADSGEWHPADSSNQQVQSSQVQIESGHVSQGGQESSSALDQGQSSLVQVESEHVDQGGQESSSAPEQDICIEVSPGTYSVTASSYDDKIRQTHLVKVQPGERVNLTFDL